ncbi:MAG: dienelactone hydrolase family protein [Lentisphaeria bacterium]|nr:dienelactone hydrolase family protein [Lentisphaeria bacterium]
MKHISALVFFVVLFISASRADVVGRSHVYSAGGLEFEGYVAYDDSVEGQRPVVLVAHQWTGLGDYEKLRARMLAEMGYLAFCVDIYGKGERAGNREQAQSYATKYRSDRRLMRQRAEAGLAAALQLPEADPDRVAAIGYCFGGGVVLELARGGADIAGIVSFHGNLDTPDADDAKRIKGSILVCHGGGDAGVPMSQVTAFHAEMEAAKVDYQLVVYAGAVHGFTHLDQPERYHEAADRRSWKHMRAFFEEILK